MRALTWRSLLLTIALPLCLTCGSTRHVTTPGGEGGGDQDGDGLPDDRDFCPTLAAEYETGCPEELHDLVVAHLIEGMSPCAGDGAPPELVCPDPREQPDPYDGSVSEEAEETRDAPGVEVEAPQAAGEEDYEPALAEAAARIEAIGDRLEQAWAVAKAAAPTAPRSPGEEEGDVMVRLMAENEGMCDDAVAELHAVARLPVFAMTVPNLAVTAAVMGIELGDERDVGLFCDLWDRQAEIRAAADEVESAWTLQNRDEIARACKALADTIGPHERDCAAKAAALAAFLPTPEADFLYRLDRLDRLYRLDRIVGEHGCDAVSSSLQFDRCRDDPGVRAAWCDNIGIRSRSRTLLTPEIADRCGLGDTPPPEPGRLTESECTWMGTRIAETAARAGVGMPGAWSTDACVEHLRGADYACIADAQTLSAMTRCRGTFAR